MCTRMWVLWIDLNIKKNSCRRCYFTDPVLIMNIMLPSGRHECVARPKACVWGHSLARVAGSNPARRRHGYLTLVSVVCCQAQIPPTGRSLVQGNPTESITKCEQASTPTISRYTGVRNTKERKKEKDMNIYWIIRTSTIPVTVRSKA